MIRVLIVDDHKVVRQGLRFLLEQEEGIEVVGECPDGTSAIQAVRTLEPTVVLLEEPSSGLDAHETEQLGEALRRVRQEQAVALVLVEHNVEFVLDLSDRVTVLDFGRVLTEGTPNEVRDSPEVQEAYFGAPVDPNQHEDTP